MLLFLKFNNSLIYFDQFVFLYLWLSRSKTKKTKWIRKIKNKKNTLQAQKTTLQSQKLEKEALSRCYVISIEPNIIFQFIFCVI